MEEPEVIHSPDGILEEDHEIKIYHIWEAFHRSNVYQHAFLQSFKNEEEMKQFEVNFTADSGNAPWHTLEVINNITGEVIKPGFWQINAYEHNTIDLGVWEYNISLKIKVLSDRQILLKEIYEVDEMNCDTHEIIIEKS